MCLRHGWFMLLYTCMYDGSPLYETLELWGWLPCLGGQRDLCMCVCACACFKCVCDCICIWGNIREKNQKIWCTIFFASIFWIYGYKVLNLTKHPSKSCYILPQNKKKELKNYVNKMLTVFGPLRFFALCHYFHVR